MDGWMDGHKWQSCAFQRAFTKHCNEPLWHVHSGTVGTVEIGI